MSPVNPTKLIARPAIVRKNPSSLMGRAYWLQKVLRTLPRSGCDPLGRANVLPDRAGRYALAVFGKVTIRSMCFTWDRSWLASHCA